MVNAVRIDAVGNRILLKTGDQVYAMRADVPNGHYCSLHNLTLNVEIVLDIVWRVV